MSNSQRPLFCNHASTEPDNEVLIVNEFKVGADNWVLISPYGRFPHSGGMQHITQGDADAIVEDFKSMGNSIQRVMGLPWYVGHPDHPGFKDRYKDTKAYGRIKELQARSDGLYANVKWNSAGKNLINEEAFHGHSTNWRVKSVNGEWHPISLKSVGFTNEPNLPVPPITVANQKDTQTMKKDILIKLLLALGQKTLTNEATDEQLNAALANCMGDDGKMKGMANADAAPPWLCELMGKPEATMEDAKSFLTTKLKANETAAQSVIDLTKKNTDLQAAHDTIGTQLSEARTKITTLTNEVAGLNTKVTEAGTSLANERKARVATILDKAIIETKITAAERPTWETEFANATDVAPVIDKLSKLTPKLNGTSIVNNAGQRNVQNLAANERVSAMVNFVNEASTKPENKGKTYEEIWADCKIKQPALFEDKK